MTPLVDRMIARRDWSDDSLHSVDRAMADFRPTVRPDGRSEDTKEIKRATVTWEDRVIRAIIE